MITGHDIRQRLTAFGRGGTADESCGGAVGISCAEAALLVGALDRPGLSLEKYHRHLDELSARAGSYARNDDGDVPVELMAEALRQVLARHLGYGGGESGGRDVDCYELTRVIDNRHGSAESLSILYGETARRLGWTAAVIQVPGRVLVRLEALGERLIVDPMGDGRPVDIADLRAIVKAFGGMEAELTPDTLFVLDDKAALLQLLAARKAALLRAKQLDEAAGLLEIALLVSPDEATLWRESGLLNARLDRIRDAVTALEEYLRLGADDAARYNTTILLQELRGRLP